MFNKSFTSKLVILLLTGLLMGAGWAIAQPRPSSDLLLPYFEVDINDPTVTTLFAVVNSSDERVPIRITVYSNWGIRVLEFKSALEARETRTVNLRDWLVLGNVRVVER